MRIDNSDLLIGKGDPEFSSGEYFHGVLDEIRLWNVARSPQEIQATWNTPLTGKEPGLVAYWTFDNDTAKDQSGHGNDGVLSPEARIGPEAATAAQPPAPPATQNQAPSPNELLKSLGWGRSSNAKIAAAYSPQWLDQIDDAWLLLKAGFALYDARRYPEALALFEKMAAKAEGDPPGQAVALIWQGHMLDLLGRRDAAVARYRKAAGLDTAESIQRHDQYGLAYSPGPYAKQRMETPFVRVENQDAD
jgi:tetratricopeptide (TPR) repeat protein